MLICPLTVSGFSLRIGKYPWVAAQVRISKCPDWFKTLNLSIKLPLYFCQYKYLSFKFLIKNSDATFSSPDKSFRKNFLVSIQDGKVSLICSFCKRDNNVGDKLIVSFVFKGFSFWEDSITWSNGI